MRTFLSAALAASTVLWISQSTAAPAAVARSEGGKAWLHAGPARLAGAPLEARARALATLKAIAPEASRLGVVVVDVETFGDGDKIVRFEQTHAGLPVVGAGAAVRLDARGEHVLSVVDLEASFPATATPSIAAGDAAQVAQRFTRLSVDATDAHLVWLPARTGPRLAYAVVPVVPFGLPTAPRIMVDAHTGAVLEARDLTQFASQAKVYDTNPQKSPSLATRDLPMTPVGGVLSNEFIQSQNCIDRQSVKQVSFQGFPLTIHVCDLAQTAQADGSGNFLFDPIDDPTNVESRRDAFSEVSMYYHASRAYEFFRTLQGDPNAQVVVDKPFRTVSNLQLAKGLFQGDLQTAARGDLPLDPMQNAFFSPAGGQLGAVFQQLYGFSSGAMWFGQGPRRDYAYDGDVVYHEFVHAVVDKTLKLEAWHLDKYGVIDSPGAMNEGLADYFSSAITGDPDVGEYASKDFDPNTTVIRTLANKDRCPTAVAGEVHWDSTLFSGGMWDARQSLPEADRSKFDAAVYKAMRNAAGRGDLGYDDLTKLFIATLKTDLPAGATALEKTMTDRGVLPECTRALEFTGAPVKAPGPMGGFAALGVGNLRGADLAPGLVQVTQKLPERTTKVTVTFTSRVQSGGGLGGFGGGGGTPFTPVVLAKFGAPVTWTTTGALKPDADVQIDATGDGGKSTIKYTATFDAPEGATSVFVQIASKGQSDGSYDSIALGVEQAAAPVDPAPTPAPPPAAAPQPIAGGCGCNAAQTHAPWGAIGLAGLGAVALVARRRRKDRP
jgi:MYXO-CTERM domain-containing protein